MDFVVAVPELVTSAAQDLAGLHSTLIESTAAAAGPTTAVVAAAQDEVSAGIAALFGALGQEYQAISAQAATFHQQFVNLLNAGAAAYVGTEAANAEQALLGALTAPAATAPAGAAAVTDPIGGAFGAYSSLFSNTSTNMQILGRSWATGTLPAMFQAFGSQFNMPLAFFTALQTGNVLPVVSQTQSLALGSANLLQELTVPAWGSLPSVTPTGTTVAFGVGVPELLAFEVLGAQINATTAAAGSAGAFFDAIASGNPVGAAVALFAAPANIANGFLNGEQTVAFNLPLPGLSVTAQVPFSGLLVPLQPFTATATVPGSPLMQTVTVTGPPVGGLIPTLVNYVPELFASAFTT
ncbi:PE family protein [Mycobacterium sp. Marseille-P9652]|uniref:PE family protein n=1 Tax=Mycobacterium sp. Marseille-P9652 TaxID=2654950 RepID=UPI0012E96F9A|nr:PE family protein [Mycobacterium sp. Marseille-P9652]